MDWQTVLYDPLYAALAVDAVLTIGETDVTKSVRVIDKTAGVELADTTVRSARRGDVSMNTIAPSCVVRATELIANDIALSQLRGSRITFNGNTWRIETRRAAPSPSGELDGEIYLILTEDRDA